MNMIKKYAYRFAIALFALSSIMACSEDELGASIFDTSASDLDPESYTYAFDKYLYENYMNIYNLEFRYKMQDVGADLNYNLVPSSFSNAEDMAVLVKYLWFDVYKVKVSPEFLRAYGPKIIHLIGSPAFNPSSGTKLLGLAEGGKKISLFQVNELSSNLSNIDYLNEQYFKTMHHEFAHVLHQTKTYPREFNLISTGLYTPTGWQYRNDSAALSMGFVSDYAGNQEREDFVEVIANYIVKTDAEWNQMLNTATKGWVVTTPYSESPTNKDECEIGADTDGVDGKAVILRKLDIAKNWLRDSWNVELDSLHVEVQRRQAKLDPKNPAYDPNLMDSLRAEINAYKIEK